MRDLGFDPREWSGYRLEVMRKAWILVAVALAGCNPAQDAVNAVFPAYRGKPVEMVFARWGAPQERLQVADGMIYAWTGSINYQPISPQTSTGTIGGRPFVINTPAPPETLTCRVEAHTDHQGRTVYIGGTGNNGACEAFYDRLR
jgi:hypothetical protein